MRPQFDRAGAHCITQNSHCGPPTQLVPSPKCVNLPHCSPFVPRYVFYIRLIIHVIRASSFGLGVFLLCDLWLAP